MDCDEPFYDRYEWDTPQQAIQGVEEWIYDFYNTKRLNSAIGYQTPVEFEAQHAAALTRAAVLRQGSCRISGFESDHTVGVWLTRE